ncbi:hypothetical protein B0H15DRAFT_958802 [Mycena belliarum]|uniref:Uncharacterized protein n=1 Tax=Mycena belliarum TaxID=1033014 RepID=A0AAD6TJY8_9AGAR|nr:hypothetical protein B0H15DRAFT_958802 [Mycena belliae]
MATGPTFTGYGTSTATAIDFLKDVRLGFSGRGMKDPEKLEEVGDRFRHASPADVWFKAATFTTWKDFEKAFETRFAGIAPITKPRPQLLAELAGMRMVLEDLAADYVLVDGAKVLPLAAFCAKLNEAVMGATAGAEAEGVWNFFSGLPAPLRLAMGSVPVTWDDMLAALGQIPQAAVDVAVEGHKHRRELEATVREMDRMLRATRISPASASPTVPQTAARIHNTPAPAAANAGANTTNANAGAGGGARGATRGREPIGMGSDAQKAQLRALLEGCIARQPPDTPDGLVRYNSQMTEWASKNGHIAPDAVSIWTTGYPLKPGTAVPCCGECWRCGTYTSGVPHRVCPKPLVPVLERKFRAYCGTWLGRVNVSPAAVHVVEVVEEVEGVPWYQGTDDANTPADGSDF